MKPVSRRSFLGTAASATVAFPFIGWKTAAAGKKPSETVQVAAFGGNGRAFGDISATMKHKSTNLVAVAEVDNARTGAVRQRFKKSKVYQDWRELLEKEAKNIDVVVVGTPDHMHAPISMAGMQLGKHCYCEKPLTRTLDECRALTEYAAEQKLITQMGNQLASGQGNKATAKALRDKVIGKVVAIHSMCPKSWGSMKPLGVSSDPPESLDWDQWIGVAKMRPYVKGEFHPAQWRKRIGYGTGTLGDMACHIVHPWCKGIDSPEVISVKSVGPAPVDEDSWPLDGRIEYNLKGNEYTDGKIPFTWYDGKNVPGDDLVQLVGDRKNIPVMGTVIVGTKGVITANHGRDPFPKIYRDGKLTDEKIDPPAAADHHGEFIDNVLGRAKGTVCDFNYAGPMTETVLLGTVAMLVPGEELKWNSKKLRFTNSAAANKHVKDKYREGWEVKGL
ncbi:MAG: oxidoreductase [Verrucomicrobiales bacterium]|nr:oxidoreductase [Verrucomicrobiales bacterium]